MSLHQLANHMSAQGRGPDSALVHMSPRELSGLQSLAMAHGGTLTINPETGLPEAGFLDSILPTLLGGAATFFSGGTITPFMAALGVGGLTALTSKDLGKGLMAGLGAYGGAGIMQGLAGFGAADIGEKAIGAATADATAAGLQNVPGSSDAYAAAMQKGVADRMAGASYSDRLKAGALKAMSNPGDAFNAIGGGSMFKGAAMLGAPLLSAISTQDQTSVPTAEQIKFDPRYANINISRQQLPYQPDTGGSKERRYFGDTYVTQYADGGAVASDGIQHFAYGGGTIDPTYNYSGYGNRNTSSVMQPITVTEAPKPDFVGADGKTYRYDPVKKSWYVIKEAEAAKVNPGVETLMGGGVNNSGDQRGPGTDNTGTGQTFYGGLANLAGEAQRAGFTTIGNFLGGLVPEGSNYNKVDLDTGNKATGTFTAADIAALSGKSDKGSSVSLGGTNTGGYEGVTNPGTTGMSTGTTGGSPAQAGDIGNPGGPAAAERGGEHLAHGGMAGYAQGGLGSLGGYSDGGRLLRGPGDGVSDSIPATVGNRQPARLADGEFVVPARIVSELGNGSTEAGARALYKMMDRIQANRRKTTGKNSVAVNSKSHKYLPA